MNTEKEVCPEELCSLPSLGGINLTLEGTIVTAEENDIIHEPTKASGLFMHKDNCLVFFSAPPTPSDFKYSSACRSHYSHLAEC